MVRPHYFTGSGVIPMRRNGIFMICSVSLNLFDCSFPHSQGNHTSKGILSALLLRQSIMRVARAQFDARSLPSTQQMLQLGALWLLPWSRVSSPLVRCLFMAWLQWSPKGALCPPLAIFTLIATALRKFSKRSAFWSLALPPMISGSITIVMHETPWLISSSYLDMLRALSGASRPLYDWRGSVMSTPNPTALAPSSDPVALAAEGLRCISSIK